MKKSKKGYLIGGALFTAIGFVIAGIIFFAPKEEKVLEKQKADTFEWVETLAMISEDRIYESLTTAIVRIEVGDIFGSGVIFQLTNQGAYILTSRHLLENQAAEDSFFVTFFDGSEVDKIQILEPEQYDMVILKIATKDLSEEMRDRYRYISYDTETFQKLVLGDEIFLFGSADYVAGNLEFGTIANTSIFMEEFQTDMLWGYCNAKGGMSGSGVFDKQGNLIGIVCGGNEWNEIAVLPLDKILEEWRKL